MSHSTGMIPIVPKSSEERKSRCRFLNENPKPKYQLYISLDNHDQWEISRILKWRYVSAIFQAI